MKQPYIKMNLVQPQYNFKPSITCITPDKTKIKEILNMLKDKGDKIIIKNINLVIFLIQMITKYISLTRINSQNSYYFKNKLKISSEIKKENIITDFDDKSNFNKIQENSPQNNNEEGFSFFEDFDNHIENETKKEENKIIDNPSEEKTESGNEKGKNMENKLENKYQQNLSTLISTEKEISPKDKKKLEYEEYFTLVEIQNGVSKITEENELIKKIRFFSSKKDKKIDIMEISVDNFLLYLESFTKNEFKGKYYIHEENNEYFISFSDWLCNKEYLTLSEIIICLFEMYIILSSYNNIELTDNKINEIYKNNQLTNIFFNIYHSSEKINDIINNDILSKKNIYKQIKKVKKDVKKLKQEAKIKNIISEVNEDFETNYIYEEDLTTKIINVIMATLPKTKKENQINILLDILFLDFDSMINGRRFIYENIREYIIHYLDPYFNYISSQINNYSIYMANATKIILSQFSFIRYFYIENILNKLRFKSNGYFKYMVLEHGSNGLGLCIEESDMDLYIYCNYINENDFRNDLKNELKNYAIVDENKKLNNLNLISFNFNYNYYNEIGLLITNSIKVDIVFTNKLEQYYKKKEIIDKIKALLNEYPEIKGCLLMLKRIFANRGLNIIYKGGMNPHSLLILLTYIKDRLLDCGEKINAGKLISLFCFEYSKFNYNYVIEKPSKRLRTKHEYIEEKKNEFNIDKRILDDINITIEDAFNEKNLIVCGFAPEKFIEIIKIFKILLEECKNMYLYFNDNKNKINNYCNFEFVLYLIKQVGK